MHLAIIPDGNRRWARLQSLLPWDGHKKAVDNFEQILDWCQEGGRITTLTIWCFSTENWKRDPEEIEKLMDLLRDFLNTQREKLIQKKVRFLHSGRKDRLPPDVIKEIEVTEQATKDDWTHTLHLAIDYGGKDEVVRSGQRLAVSGQQPTEETIKAHLDQPDLPDIDLILRSSGEKRTSNFFLWQSAYSEWIFLDKHFPEITTQDLEKALEEYDSRKRRYGA